MEDFQRLEKIGEGTFGVVYRALWKSKQQLVAIKVPKDGEEDQQNVLREIVALKELTGNANIVKLLKVFPHKDSFCLVFELFRDSLWDVLWLHKKQTSQKILAVKVRSSAFDLPSDKA